MIVVLNMANRAYDSYTIGFPRAGLWRVRLNSDWPGYDAEFGGHDSYDTTAAPDGRDTMPYSGNVRIGPWISSPAPSVAAQRSKPRAL